MIALKCPACSAPLEVAENREQFFCQFCGTPIVLSQALRSQTQNAPEADGVVGPKPDVPIPSDLKVEEFGNELNLSWSWFSWAVLFLIPFCIAWNSFLVGWYSMLGSFGGMPGPMEWIFAIFPIGHVAVGLGLIYGVLTMLFNRTVIQVSQGTLSVRHTPIYYPGGTSVQTDEIEQVYCVEDAPKGSGNDDRTPTYSLMARLRSGVEVRLVRKSTNDRVLRAVEQLIERHLQIKDRRVAGEM